MMKRSRKIILGIVGLVVICIVAAIIISSVNMSTPEGQATATVRAAEREATQATRSSETTAEAMVEATEDARPTDIPLPTDTPAPTSTPTPDGSSPEMAIPFGVEGVTRDFNLLIDEIERPADATIEEGNEFNSDPEPGNEYMMVKLTVTCTKASDETCSVSPSIDVEMFGSQGVIREPKGFIVGVPGIWESTEFFGGRSVSGWLVFEVGQEETDFVLKFEPLFSLTPAIYLAVPDQNPG